MKEVVAYNSPVHICKVRKYHSCIFQYCLSISYIANKNPIMSIKGSYIYSVERDHLNEFHSRLIVWVYRKGCGISPDPPLYNLVKSIDDNYSYLNSRARLLQGEGKLLKRLLASSSFPGPQWDAIHTLMACSCSNHYFVQNDFSKQLDAIQRVLIDHFRRMVCCFDAAPYTIQRNVYK